MALTVTRPNYWTITLDSSGTGVVYKFKYVVLATFPSPIGTVQLRQSKNPQGNGHFDIEKLVKNYLKVTHKHANTITGSIDYDSIHLMPQNTTDVGTATTPDREDYPLSKNNDTIISVTFNCWEEYSTTADATPDLQGTPETVTYPFINYANEWEDEKDLQENLFGLNSNTQGRFLSELPFDTLHSNSTVGKIPHLTSFNDYKTFSWFNEYNTYFDTADGSLMYYFFDDVPSYVVESGQKIPTNHVGAIQVDNNSDNGGHLPSTANSDDEYLLFGGVGGANVKNIKYPDKGGYQLLESSNVKYYTVNYVDDNSVIDVLYVGESGLTIKAGDKILIASAGGIDYTLIGAANNNVGTQFYATGGTTGLGTFYKRVPINESKTYLFEIASDTNCNSTRFDEYSLTWKNKYGTWDYYMFDGEHTDVRNYKRETDYNRLAGGWSDATFTIDSFERGKVQKVNGTKQTTINTRYITDEYNDYFNGLLMSNEVLLLSPVKKGDDDIKQVPIPINIQDTSLTYKTNLKDKLVQYSFTFEYAHNLKQRV